MLGFVPQPNLQTLILILLILINLFLSQQKMILKLLNLIVGWVKGALII